MDFHCGPGVEASDAGWGSDPRTGAQAKAAKIKAKGGKYSTKRRAWKSIIPKSRETNSPSAVRASILRPVNPRARMPLAKAIRAGSELSKSCLVSYGYHSLPTRTEVASASLGNM